MASNYILVSLDVTTHKTDPRKPLGLDNLTPNSYSSKIVLALDTNIYYKSVFKLNQLPQGHCLLIWKLLRAAWRLNDLDPSGSKGKRRIGSPWGPIANESNYIRYGISKLVYPLENGDRNIGMRIQADGAPRISSEGVADITMAVQDMERQIQELRPPARPQLEGRKSGRRKQ